MFTKGPAAAKIELYTLAHALWLLAELAEINVHPVLKYSNVAILYVGEKIFQRSL